MAAKVSVKQFVVVPRDAFDLLTRRHGSFADAVSEAEANCAETGMATMVIELKAIASRADRPVKVTKL